MAGRRRTQAERREATQKALLEATLECLVDTGYTRMTAGRIASRAGVTRGAQAHYFATKAELVEAALTYATEALCREFREHLPLRPTEAETVLAMIDQLWALHESKTFTAVLEIWVASRTDPELRPHVAKLGKQLTGVMSEIVSDAVPDFLRRPDGVPVLLTAFSIIRGVLVMGYVSSKRTTAALWEANRGVLEKLVTDVIQETR